MDVVAAVYYGLMGSMAAAPVLVRLGVEEDEVIGLFLDYPWVAVAASFLLLVSVPLAVAVLGSWVLR